MHQFQATKVEAMSSMNPSLIVVNYHGRSLDKTSMVERYGGGWATYDGCPHAGLGAWDAIWEATPSALEVPPSTSCMFLRRSQLTQTATLARKWPVTSWSEVELLGLCDGDTTCFAWSELIGTVSSFCFVIHGTYNVQLYVASCVCLIKVVSCRIRDGWIVHICSAMWTCTFKSV